MSKPIVCYVTDRKSAGFADSRKGALNSVRAAMEAGVDWVQIREKDLGARELFAIASEAVAIKSTGGYKTRVLVNDRLDVAIAAGADGVHLRSDSMSAGDVVRWRRDGNRRAEFLVGVSCHSREEVRRAQESGASYAFFGPIFDTPSKRSFGAPKGTEILGEVCRGLSIPVIAIGGITEENGAECLGAGAAGIAAIRMFQEVRDATSLKAAVDRLHQGAG